jgi:hypothetical protein
MSYSEKTEGMIRASKFLANADMWDIAYSKGITLSESHEMLEMADWDEEEFKRLLDAAPTIRDWNAEARVKSGRAK